MPKFTEEMAKRLRRLSIKSGSHDNGKQFCIMEAVSYIAGQPHSDNPVCVADSITQFLIGINDSRSSDKERNRLKKVVPDIMGTRPTEVKPGQFYNNKGDLVDGLLEKPKMTKGYAKGENRRTKLLRSFMLDKTGDEFNDDYREIATKDAIELARKMAAVKNKA